MEWHASARSAAFRPLQRAWFKGRFTSLWLPGLKRRERRAPVAPLALSAFSISDFGLSWDDAVEIGEFRPTQRRRGREEPQRKAVGSEQFRAQVGVTLPLRISASSAPLRWNQSTFN
jgi:hypothetical protein